MTNRGLEEFKRTKFPRLLIGGYSEDAVAVRTDMLLPRLQKPRGPTHPITEGAESHSQLKRQLQSYNYADICGI